MTQLKKIAWRICLRLVVISVVSLFFSCAYHSKWATRLDWEEFQFADLPGDKDYPDAGAIIILDEGKMGIIGSSELPQSVFERHKIVKILNTRGQRYANVAIAYTPKTQIENIQARTISPNGKITVLDKANIYDINLYPNFVFYADQRAKLFTMPAVENNAVIEYRYRMRIGSRSLWPSWSFQNEAPTLKSRFTVEAPSEWDLNYKLYDIDLEPSISKSPKGFKSKYVWEAKAVPALKFEFGMPQRNECISRLELAPVGIKTWDDVALWYHELADPQIKAGPNVEQLALKLTEGIENDEEKLKVIYEWVREHVRYIAVAIGIGGFQPHAADEILVNRYGDCKDMTTLLCSLARKVGIEAYEALVSTWQNGVPDTSLPSPFQFNHAIAFCPSIGERGVWMDATEKGCPYGKIPWYDQGLPVLVVKKDGKAEIITTPRAPADSNHTSLDWRVELQETGAATIQGKTQFRGAFATEIREELYSASSDELKLWLEIYLAKRCSGAKLDSFQIIGLSPLCDPLIISYTFHTAKFALLRAREMVFRPGQILAFDLPDYFRSINREFPIRFRFGSHTELNLTVELPNDWEVRMLMPSDSLVSPFGKTSWSCINYENKFHVHINCYIYGESIDPQHYQDFQNFLDGIRERDLREVILSESEYNKDRTFKKLDECY